MSSSRRFQRRSIRLPGYNYAQAGTYFVTICTHGYEYLFGLDRREATRRLKAFLRQQGRGHESRVVLIIHGKGTRVLAENIGRELDHHSLVAEHFRAPPRLGGDGARVARLKRLDS